MQGENTYVKLSLSLFLWVMEGFQHFYSQINTSF